jgi:hypothetical protein
MHCQYECTCCAGKPTCALTAGLVGWHFLTRHRTLQCACNHTPQPPCKHSGCCCKHTGCCCWVCGCYLEGLSHDLLCLSLSIHLRVVKEVDASITRCRQQCLGLQPTQTQSGCIRMRVRTPAICADCTTRLAVECALAS